MVSRRSRPADAGRPHDLDHAVARGAAYYGWAKHRGGLRIRGGTARAIMWASRRPGWPCPGPAAARALCVVPIGMEEGTEIDVPSDEIGLIVGEPAQFRFFSSSTRRGPARRRRCPPGSTDELEETDPLETTLPADRGHRRGLRAGPLPLEGHRIGRAGVLRERETTAAGSWSSACGMRRRSNEEHEKSRTQDPLRRGCPAAPNA